MSEETEPGRVQQSLDDLQRKLDILTAEYGIGSFASFWLDQVSGTLEFRDASGSPRVIAEVLPVGSHSRRGQTWMWAWANETLVPELRQRAEPLRELATEMGISLLADPVLDVTDAEPWELTALAVTHLGALGAYRAPGRNADLYLAIMGIHRASPA